ncbi:MAG: nucleotidyltransferase domain-containing protein [Candidatus Methanoperedens sp.]|nr:nucleotidyltransferase domain-containing protein [Candidatus Methanoperedens sp.]
MFKIMNIFSKPSIQIICYLGRRYRDGYYVREISRNLDISLGSASQSLRTLEEAGLVLKEHRGRLVIYRANMRNFLLREFKILLTLLEIDPFILRLKEISSRIILFGSCAAGEDTIESDIDIFIESDNKRKVAMIHDHYQEEIPRKISPIILEASEFRILELKDRPLYERINMGKVIHEA